MFNRKAVLCGGIFLSVIALSPAEAALVISDKATSNVNCTAGVCTATAKNAILNVGDLATMLNASEVSVIAGNQAKNIAVEAAVTWASSRRLTLDAYQSISVSKEVVVQGTGALTLVTNDGGAHGDYVFTGRGHVEFWDLASSLVINGTSYTLVGDTASLASAVQSDPNGAYALARNYNAKSDGKRQGAVVTASFNGLFEGLGNTISYLQFKQLHRDSEPTGLFGVISAGGRVRDIRVTKAFAESSRTTNQTCISLLVGFNAGYVTHAYAQGVLDGHWGHDGGAGGLSCSNNGTISDAHADVVIVGDADIFLGSSGALSASNAGLIDGSDATGSVALGNYSGGLVGVNAGTISNSRASTVLTQHATGAVGGVGGLVGWNKTAGAISKSFATGAVTGDQVGGLVGFDQGAINQAFASGAITESASGYAGGLVGVKYGGTIANAYAKGSVTGSMNSTNGGLIGVNRDSSGFPTTITSVYATGALSGTGLGGVIGEDGVPPGDITSAYWDLDTTGVSDPSHGAGSPANDPGITGLSDAALKSALPSGFDSAIWAQSPSINSSYPYLRAVPPG